MSKWDEVHTEPLHDHPAKKDQLVAAMEAAGYVLDTLESTEDNLRFYGAYGNVMTMGGWHECEEWLNGVVFDDPQVSNLAQPDPAEALRPQTRKSEASEERHSVLEILKTRQEEAAKAAGKTEEETRKHRLKILQEEVPMRV